MTKRERILEAAAEAFAADGYAATSYSTIAARLGMHRNALQHYVSSKAELAAEIAWLPFKAGAFLEESGAVAAGVEGIRQLAVQISANYVSSVFPRASMRLMEQRHLIPAQLPVPFRGWVGPTMRMLRQGIDDGDIDADTDVEWVAWTIVSCFAGTRLVCEMLDELPFFPERVSNAVDDILRAHAAR